MTSPGRIAEYSHLECSFEYSVPVFTPVPEVQPSPEKKKRVVNRPAWKRFQWTCNVQCDHCHYDHSDNDHSDIVMGSEGPHVDSEVPVHGSRGTGRTTDKRLLLTAAGSTCSSKCKLKCATNFPMESRLKVRKLRHEHYSTGA